MSIPFKSRADDQALCLTNCPIVHHCISDDSQGVPCIPDQILIAVVCSLVSAGTRGHLWPKC